MSAPVVTSINGRRVEWTPCRKHEQHAAVGYLVLSCKRCVILVATPESQVPETKGARA